MDEEQALLALKLLAEGNSIRSAERISGINQKTIMHLLEIAGERCENLLTSAIRNVPAKDVQADEIWQFVDSSERKKATSSTGTARMSATPGASSRLKGPQSWFWRSASAPTLCFYTQECPGRCGFTRLTYDFSKKWEHHKAARALHFAPITTSAAFIRL